MNIGKIIVGYLSKNNITKYHDEMHEIEKWIRGHPNFIETPSDEVIRRLLNNWFLK
jgi:hypothetical protein